MSVHSLNHYSVYFSLHVLVSDYWSSIMWLVHLANKYLGRLDQIIKPQTRYKPINPITAFSLRLVKPQTQAKRMYLSKTVEWKTNHWLKSHETRSQASGIGHWIICV